MYENLKQTLSLSGIKCDTPYYLLLNNTTKEFPIKQFRTDFYTLLICTKGSLQIEIDSKVYDLSENSFLISSPTTIIKLRKKTANFKMNLLLFEKNFLLKNITNPFIIEKLVFFQNNSFALLNEKKKVINKLSGFLVYLEETKNKKGRFSDEIIRIIIFNTLLEIAEIADEQSTKSKVAQQFQSDLFLKFKELVRENILVNKSVQFYADKLNISNQYLIEVVKKSNKKTPHEVINELLLKEAYVLLGDSKLTITEIAFKLQFNSTSAFGRFFKKYSSISPSQYRINENLIN